LKRGADNQADNQAKRQEAIHAAMHQRLAAATAAAAVMYMPLPSVRVKEHSAWASDAFLRIF
jgi:hypothetical protein